MNVAVAWLVVCALTAGGKKNRKPRRAPVKHEQHAPHPQAATVTEAARIDSDPPPSAPAEVKVVTAPAQQSARPGSSPTLATSVVVKPLSARAEAAARTLPALSLRISMAGGVRSLAFADDLFGRFASFDGFMPTLQGKLIYRPGRHISSGVASWFGALVEGGYSFVVGARDATSGAVVPVSAFFVGGGLEIRAPFGPVDIAALLLVEHRSFSFGDSPPGVVLLSLRALSLVPGLQIRVALPAGFSLSAEGRYVGVLDAGLGAKLPRARAVGVVAMLDLSYEIGKGFGVSAGAEFRQLGLDFRSQPGDTLVAGGAVDRQFFGTAGITWSSGP